jgi:hypothetical protein
MTNGVKNNLQSVQVEAGSIITGLRVNSSRSKLYSELGWNLFMKKERNIYIYFGDPDPDDSEY